MIEYIKIQATEFVATYQLIFFIIWTFIPQQTFQWIPWFSFFHLRLPFVWLLSDGRYIFLYYDLNSGTFEVIWWCCGFIWDFGLLRFYFNNFFQHGLLSTVVIKLSNIRLALAWFLKKTDWEKRNLMPLFGLGSTRRGSGSDTGDESAKLAALWLQIKETSKRY